MQSESLYELPSEVVTSGGDDFELIPTQSMDWLKEFEIKVDYTWADLSSSHNYGRILGWGLRPLDGGNRGTLHIARNGANYYVEIKGNNGSGLIVENNGGTGSSFSGLNDADSPESNIRYKMIAKNIPSSNEFIIAIQKYDDFTSWENTLANKRLLTTTTILNGGNTLVTYDNGCLLYTSPSPRDLSTSRMPSSA